MQSLMAAGSELGQRMLGMITRTPRLLLSSSSPAASSAPAPGHHHGQHGENHFPDFTNCDCHFGKTLDMRPSLQWIVDIGSLISSSNYFSLRNPISTIYYHCLIYASDSILTLVRCWLSYSSSVPASLQWYWELRSSSCSSAGVLWQSPGSSSSSLSTSSS